MKDHLNLDPQEDNQEVSNEMKTRILKLFDTDFEVAIIRMIK